MNLLLDTHVLLWWLKEPDKLEAGACNLIRDPQNTVRYSAANIWEIAIKIALGKLPLIDKNLMEVALIKDGIRPLPITPDHAWGVLELPRHHNDPFDRMLVAQARHESLRLVTRDPQLEAYGIDLLRA